MMAFLYTMISSTQMVLSIRYLSYMMAFLYTITSSPQTVFSIR